MKNNHFLTPANDATQHLISQLYTATSRIELQEFRHWALAQLQNVIDFDGAIWSNGHQQTLTFHNHTLFNVADELGELLLTHLSINPMADVLLTNLGLPIDMRDLLGDDEFYQSEIYHQCFQPMGIERILASIHLDERSGLFTLLTLYRFDRSKPFTQQDKAIQSNLLYHLLKSSEHALFVTLEQQAGNEAHTHLGICDAKGYFHQAQSSLLDLLERHFPDQTYDRLPEPLLQVFNHLIDSKHKVKTDSSGEKIQLKVRPFNELYLLEIWPNGPLDILTSREKQVVDAINKGMTFKQAAQHLALSPSTVSNHLYRIYQKLNIGSRAQLHALLNNRQPIT